MRLVSFETGGTLGAGFLDGDEVVLVRKGAGAERAVLEVIERGTEEVAAWEAVRPRGERLPLGAVRLLAPMPEPRRNILCVGKNYRAHAAEVQGIATKDPVPASPILFTKATAAVVGPGATVRASPS